MQKSFLRPSGDCYRFIREALGPFRAYLYGLFGVAFYLGLDPSIFSYLLKAMLDTMAQAKTSGAWLPAITVLAIYIGTGAICAVLFRLNDWLLMYIKPGLERTIANKLIDHLTAHAHQFYQEHMTGNLISKFNDVAESIPDLLEILVSRITFRIVTIIAGILTLWLFMPTAAAIMGIWAAGFIIGAALVARKIHALSEEASEVHAQATGETTDTLANMLSVRLFSARDFERGRISTVFKDWFDAIQRREWFLIKFYTLLCFWWILRDITSLWLIAHLFAHDQISLGDVAMFISMSVHFTMILWDITQDISKSVKLWGKITQGLTTLLTPPAIIDQAYAPELAVQHGKIIFSDVSFAYRTGIPLFNKLSVTIGSGQKVGLVGYSGAGKTTFVNLLLRLYDIQSGSISIDGQDIAQVTQKSLREHIAFIPQEPSLFHRTIRENIRYGNHYASDQEVIEAAQRAHADEFIRLIPEGYDALVGDRGIKLSGGQRQRIAIARAFLKHAHILVMDEATSALDSVTEKYIQESFSDLMTNCTTLVIAHRLATLLAMDRILVFDNGQIVEDGSHAELMDRNGLYATMWRAQSCGFLADVA
jgi:ATP-binding cassette subfamily B protein